MINNKLPPDVCVIIDALRNTGYSFEAAVSDIIDNSIDAKATQIKVIFPINKENISLSIIDNGVGMSKEELSEAMKFGSVKNGLSRNETALGKFSLGLKTASLSQCSILTVLTKKNNSMCAMS
jgi:signal transduction histidine kinase